VIDAPLCVPARPPHPNKIDDTPRGSGTGSIVMLSGTAALETSISPRASRPPRQAAAGQKGD